MKIRIEQGTIIAGQASWPSYMTVPDKVTNALVLTAVATLKVPTPEDMYLGSLAFNSDDLLLVIDGESSPIADDFSQHPSMVGAFIDILKSHANGLFVELYALEALQDEPVTELLPMTVDKSRQEGDVWIEEFVEEEHKMPVVDVFDVVDTEGKPVFELPLQRRTAKGEHVFKAPRPSQLDKKGKLRPGEKLDPAMDDPVRRVHRVPRIRKVTDEQIARRSELRIEVDAL